MAFHKNWRYEPSPVHDHLHVRLLALDFVPLNKSWRGEGVRSSYWRLYIHQREGAAVSVAGRPYPLVPDRIHLIPAWITFDCHTQRPLDQFFIHFDLVGWPPALIRDLFSTPITLPHHAEALELFARLSALIPQKGRGSPEILGIAKALVYLAIGQIIPTTADARSSRWDLLLAGPSPVSEAVHHVEAYYPRDISNDTLAQRCHMSKSHFIRTFRKYLGQTPAQYIRERRVARAAEQLALTNATIDEIAANSGFANRFYFTRAFTTVMGIAPARYRAMAI
jgi:AraC-like DNA-binding protein